MTEQKVTFLDDTVIVPRDAYIEHIRCVQEMRNLIEQTEGVGDEMFQSHILLGMVYLLTRTAANIEFTNRGDELPQAFGAFLCASGRSKGGDVAEARLSRSGYAGARRRGRSRQRHAQAGGWRRRPKPGRQRYNGGTV